MTKRNPKQDGSDLFDCVPQSGKCPMNCSNCFFNRPGAFYTETPSIPTPEEIGDGIVRMNCGHDSNIERKLVVETAQQYKHYFFNTSIPRFDFPGPVVLTANRNEEEKAIMPPFDALPANLMFVRLRVSATNLYWISQAVHNWTGVGVPVVLTFMAYYDREPEVPTDVAQVVGGPCYEWKVRILNPYFCPTTAFKRMVRQLYIDNRLVSMCGGLDGALCKDCRNCETYYWQTIKRMRGE